MKKLTKRELIALARKVWKSRTDHILYGRSHLVLTGREAAALAGKL